MKTLAASHLALLPSLLLIGCPPPGPPLGDLTANISSIYSANSLQPEPGTAISIIIDTSGSMRGSKFDDTKRVFKDIIFPRLISSKEPLEYSILCFEGSRASVLRNNALVGEDSEKQIEQIDALTANSSTPLGETLLESYAQLAMSRRKNKIIFMLSDGEANGFDPGLVIRSFQDRGINCDIFVVGFKSNRIYYDSIAALGGQIIMAEDAKTLSDTCDFLFKKILKIEEE